VSLAISELRKAAATVEVLLIVPPAEVGPKVANKANVGTTEAVP